jgi:hypothetical protein
VADAIEKKIRDHAADIVDSLMSSGDSEGGGED